MDVAVAVAVVDSNQGRLLNKEERLKPLNMLLETFLYGMEVPKGGLEFLSLSFWMGLLGASIGFLSPVE